MSFRLRSFLFLILFCDTVSAYSQQKKPAPASLPLNPQDGETVVFLGDSITHQCLYTQYLENFFVTRYPDRKIRFHNAGVSGDKAGDCLTRFEADVSIFEPDYVLVLLGMNDGQYADFDPEVVETYQAGMSELLDRISKIGAKAIVLSPTMFDHGTVTRRKDDEQWRFRTRTFSTNYNALMAYFGAWGLDETGRRGLPFVNLWGPLNEHTIAQRRTKPQFTMIDDAIHPQASGQMVMAFEILSQLGVERSSASAITLVKRGKKWVGRGLENILAKDDGTEISFSHTARSLPWVIPVEQASKGLKWGLPSDGRLGYRLTKAGHKMSADRVKIVGLEPGTYEISIDDQVIGTWNQVALGTKIELQENEKTPQFQQALRVALLNQKRNDDIIRPLRDTWSRIKGKRKAKPGPGQDDQLAKLLASAADLAQKEEAALQEIYSAAQPLSRKWKIRKVSE